jgi:hypothetical protein
MAIGKQRSEHASARRGVSAVAIFVVLFVLLVWSSGALASEHHPKDEFASFADCPLDNPIVKQCLVAEITSGEIAVGKKIIPIDKPITLQGGSMLNLETEQELFFGAEDGNTLSKTILDVPGGLVGIIAPGYLPQSLRKLFDMNVVSATRVTVTAELARPASMIQLKTGALIEGAGVALQLPLRVKLNNPLLGGDCYVGSSQSPIIVNLTSGPTDPPAPNRPIEGSVGHYEFQDGSDIVIATGISLVDNSFAAPQAAGCGGPYSTVVDSAVDAELGLPSAAGHNTAILNGNLKRGYAQTVRENE